MSKEIPYYRPFKINTKIGGESVIMDAFQQRLDEILTERIYTRGKNVMEFEERLKGLLGVEYVHTCSSGSMALLIALQAVSLKKRYPYNTVALPAFTWGSDLWAVAQSASTPLFVDIDLDSWCIEVAPFNADAVIAVHTFGNVTQVETEKDVPVIYDAAHAWGADIKDWGDVTIFSLAPTKNITTGEGGVLATNDREISKKIVEQRELVSRMSEFHAVVGLAYLDIFDISMKKQKQIWEFYYKELTKFNKISGDMLLKLQQIKHSHSHNYFGVCAVPEFYKKILQDAEGKMELRHYYNPPLLQGVLPNTDLVASTIINLPVHETVDQKKVLKCLLKS